MIEIYVEVIDGYIEGWSEEELPNWRLIKTDQTLIGKLSRVKVVNDVAVLDESKQDQFEQENNNETLLEKVMKENRELKHNQEIQNEAIAELGAVVAELAGGEANG